MAVFKPAQSSDDVSRFGSSLSKTDIFVYLGFTAESIIGAFRFVNVTIPPGATILTAKATIRPVWTESGTPVHVKIKGQSSDDAATFSTVANFDARSKTTAYVDWNNLPTMAGNTDYDSPDISDIIQEIIDISGWDSGNSMVLFFENNGSSAYRHARSYDYDAVNPTRLTVTWETGHTLTAGGGSYSKTGQGAGLRAARKLSALSSSLVLAGEPVTLKAIRKVSAGEGSYPLSGQLASLRVGKQIAADPDSYSLSGLAADLKRTRRIAASSGFYSLTGQAVVLRAIRKMAVEGASYFLTGQAANLFIGQHYILMAEQGSYGEPYSKIFVTLDGRIYKKMGNTYLRIA